MNLRSIFQFLAIQKNTSCFLPQYLECGHSFYLCTRYWQQQEAIGFSISTKLLLSGNTVSSFQHDVWPCWCMGVSFFSLKRAFISNRAIICHSDFHYLRLKPVQRRIQNSVDHLVWNTLSIFAKKHSISVVRLGFEHTSALCKTFTRATISLKKSYKKGKESNQGNSLVTFNFAIFNLISLCKKMSRYNLISMRSDWQ